MVFEIEMDNGLNIYCANKAEWDFYSEPVVELNELNEKNSTKLSVFPNPAQSTFFVELTNEDECIEKIEILNLKGENIVSINILEGSPKNIFPINNKLTKGIYIVKTTSNEDSYFSRICISD